MPETTNIEPCENIIFWKIDYVQIEFFCFVLFFFASPLCQINFIWKEEVWELRDVYVFVQGN